MKRMFLAATIFVVVALPRPSKAIDGCVALDQEHNLTTMLKIGGAIDVLIPLTKVIDAHFARDRSEQNLELLKQVQALVTSTLEIYKHCEKINKAGKPI